MNILVFSTVFYPAVGGLENQTLILLREFIKHGHRVKVITYQKQQYPLADVEVYETPGFFQKMKLFLWCHVYYMPNISLKGIMPLFLNTLLKAKKRWVISHNDFYLENKKSFFIKLKRLLIKKASTNIAVSSSVAGYIDTHSTVIYNCYDESIFKLYRDEVRSYDFVFLGRLVSQKGCHVLLEACAKLKQPFTLTIIGEGPEQETLEQIVAMHSMKSKVRFLGTLRGVELARMLNRHRVMIVPSAKSEGFGIVVLEGLACGCKLVVSDAAGLKEAVGGHGDIFKMNDATALAQLLSKHLQKIEPATIPLHLQTYLQDHTRRVVSEKYLHSFGVVLTSGSHTYVHNPVLERGRTS
jgi:glycogen synthase